MKPNLDPINFSQDVILELPNDTSPGDSNVIDGKF